MKRVLLLLCFLPWLLPASSQELPDSTFLDAEMEDSISGMSIIPVEHPEELLRRVLERLENDLQQRHSKRDYKLEGLIGIQRPSALYVYRTFTVEDDNGIGVFDFKHVTNQSPLSFEGPYRITLQDSTDIELTIKGDADLYTNAIRVKGYRSGRFFIRALFAELKLEKVLKGILEAYEVTAYRIIDESGRGVYRIHFDEREPAKWEKDTIDFHNEKIKWYIDQQSLRLIQINISQDRLGYRHNVYKHVYGEENGYPVLQKFIGAIYKGGYLIRWTGVKLVNSDNEIERVIK